MFIPCGIEEVVQEVWFRLIKDDFRLLRAFTPQRAKLGRWLNVVAESVALDYLRKRKPDTIPLGEAPDIADPRAISDYGVDFPDGLLTPCEERILRLSFGKELTPTEIAERSNMSRASVGMRKSIALNKLRRYFAHDSTAKEK